MSYMIKVHAVIPQLYGVTCLELSSYLHVAQIVSFGELLSLELDLIAHKY